MKEEAQEIQDYLEITCSNDPNEIVERMATLSVYMARSGQMLADAKKEVSIIKKSGVARQVIGMLGKGLPLSATTQKAIIEGLAVDEQHLVDWLDRINRTITHNIDALRSVLSYEKEQLRITKTGY